MARLSKSHEQARRRLLDLAAGGFAPNRLAAQMMDVLQEAVGWDGYRVFGLDERTHLVNRLLAASENDADARLEFLREVYLALPATYAEMPELSRSGLKTVAYQERQEDCWGFPMDQLTLVHPKDHYRHFHDYRSPLGGAAIGILRDGDRPIAAFQTYRRQPERQFRPGDIVFLDQMSMIIGRALAASLAREQAQAQAVTESPDASGILMIEHSGAIRYATPAGERWLQALGYDAHGLPTAIWSAMAELRSGRNRTSSVIMVPTAQSMVRIEATPAGEENVTAFVIARQLPPALPEVPLSWQLTSQERQVVQQLATGKSNREIAAAMFIGEHTVEWHLRKVYDKLGVRSRQEVTTALFRQVFLPGVEEMELSDSVA
jgi:DNA-binding CsgD family transcriptional regulator